MRGKMKWKSLKWRPNNNEQNRGETNNHRERLKEGARTVRKTKRKQRKGLKKTKVFVPTVLSLLLLFFPLNIAFILQVVYDRKDRNSDFKTVSTLNSPSLTNLAPKSSLSEDDALNSYVYNQIFFLPLKRFMSIIVQLQKVLLAMLILYP